MPKQWWLYVCLTYGPTALTLFAAALIWWRYHHRSRRASTFVLVGLAAVAGHWLLSVGFWITTDVWQKALSEDALRAVSWAQVWLRWFCWSGCLLLLVWAAFADRGTAHSVGPKADYADGHGLQRPWDGVGPPPNG